MTAGAAIIPAVVIAMIPAPHASEGRTSFMSPTAVMMFTAAGLYCLSHCSLYDSYALTRSANDSGDSFFRGFGGVGFLRIDSPSGDTAATFGSPGVYVLVPAGAVTPGRGAAG